MPQALLALTTFTHLILQSTFQALSDLFFVVVVLLRFCCIGLQCSRIWGRFLLSLWHWWENQKYYNFKYSCKSEMRACFKYCRKEFPSAFVLLTARPSHLTSRPCVEQTNTHQPTPTHIHSRDVQQRSSTRVLGRDSNDRSWKRWSWGKKNSDWL